MIKKKGSNLLTDDAVINRIYYIRNQKVMIDRDLAELYGIQSRRLREQVKRNRKRFPPHFMFQLTESEAIDMVSQNATPSWQHLGGSLPYAFTEHGVLMLANVIKSETAVTVSLRLIEIFVKMREMLSTNRDILTKLKQLEKKVMGHDQDIKTVFVALKQLLKPSQESRPRIGYRRKDEKD